MRGKEAEKVDVWDEIRRQQYAKTQIEAKRKKFFGKKEQKNTYLLL
jgi:hypothetical protein